MTTVLYLHIPLLFPLSFFLSFFLSFLSTQWSSEQSLGGQCFLCGCAAVLDGSREIAHSSEWQMATTRYVDIGDWQIVWCGCFGFIFYIVEMSLIYVLHRTNLLKLQIIWYRHLYFSFHTPLSPCKFLFTLPTIIHSILLSLFLFLNSTLHFSSSQPVHQRFVWNL